MATQSSPTPFRPWLHSLAVLLVIAVFLLLALGGTVTSYRAGLSVPDWPTSFGHGMYSVPWRLWNQGGAFWEHSHRLAGSAVGILTVLLVVAVWMTQRSRPWLLALAAAAVLLVIVQGVMGGLRVTEHPTHQRLALVLAVAHGVTGQLFLAVCVVIAAALSRWWLQPHACGNAHRTAPAVRLRRATITLLVALVLQLLLGATVRHSGAGAAIPDFPTNFGRLIPPFSHQAIAAAAAALGDTNLAQYATPRLVALHFAHRLWAIAVLASLAWVVLELRDVAEQPRLLRPAYVLVALTIIQLALAALVVWTRLHPHLATAHQATGAALLAVAVLLTLRTCRPAAPPTTDNLAQFAPAP